MIIQKKIPLSLLEYYDFLCFEFSLHLLYCMCALSISELLLCYLKILSSSQQLKQLKSLNAIKLTLLVLLTLYGTKRLCRYSKMSQKQELKSWYSLVCDFLFAA